MCVYVSVREGCGCGGWSSKVGRDSCHRDRKGMMGQSKEMTGMKVVVSDLTGYLYFSI